jgi:hypothetical protein
MKTKSKGNWTHHALWAGVALGAFALGTWRNARSDSQNGPRAILAAESLSDRANAAREKSPQGSQAPTTQLLSGPKLTESQLTALANTAVKDGNPVTRRIAFAKLLESLTPENAAAARAQLLELGAEGAVWRDFHYAWGAIDGQKAMANAMESPQDDMAATMAGWASANPDAALAQLDNLPPERKEQRERLVASLVAGMADSDPAAATAYILRETANGNAKAARLMDIVANETVSVLGPAAAAAWAQGLPSGDAKGAAMGRVADAYVRSDPKAAAAWAESVATGEQGDRVVERVGSRWARQSPGAAADWLQKLPATPGQSRGLSSAFGDWEDRDPVAAGDYLYKMPKTPQRDSAISGFATGYAWQDPQTAIAWAQDIRDPNVRESSLIQVAKAYHSRDPNGALAWLPLSGLSAEAQRKAITK